jgi:hypothetical protein
MVGGQRRALLWWLDQRYAEQYIERFTEQYIEWRAVKNTERRRDDSRTLATWVESTIGPVGDGAHR